MPGKTKKSFLYNNSLSIAFLILTFLSLGGQSITGWNQYNEFLKEHHQNTISYLPYLRSGHFLQATFENWESEFFQMTLFVWFTVFLRQKGSSESKEINGKGQSDRLPKKHPDAPWPVKKGGIILTIYKHSLSLSLMLLFIVSFV